MLAIEVRDLSFSYGEQRALHSLTLGVEEREIFGLLGPNGGGKSTLFRILCTLLAPQAGRAKVCGWDVAATPYQVRNCIGVVFQSSSLDPHLTVEENLRCQGRLYGLGGRKLASRMEHLIRHYGLSDHRRKLVRDLSGGLKRRAELIKGLLHEPRLLLLDEPTQGLDPLARRSFWEHLFYLNQKRGMTIFVTTHLLDEAEKCHRIGILHRGRLLVEGSPARLKERVGGDVLTLQVADPESFCRRLQGRLSALAPRVVDGTVRIEHPKGQQLLDQLLRLYGEEIQSVTLGKPTLEDVFVHETGQSFSPNSRDRILSHSEQ